MTLFKGRLIENQIYYKLKIHQRWLFILSSTAFALLGSFYSLPAGVTIAVCLALVVIFIYEQKNQKSLTKVVNKKIEVSKDRIQIKTEGGTVTESINIKTSDELKVPSNYKYVSETIKESLEEMDHHKIKKNFIVIKKNNSERKLYFEITSYYMLHQLIKIIEQWKNENYNIQYL